MGPKLGAGRESSPALPSRRGGWVARATERFEQHPGVVVEPWFAEELGQSSHLLEVEGSPTTVIIDPRRDADTYPAALESRGDDPLLSLETHVDHEFISGSRELAEAKNPEIGASKDSPLRYPHHPE